MYATDENGYITSPGKFEGEPAWVPDLFEKDADDTISEEGFGWYGLYLDVENVGSVILHEREDGFVFSDVYATAEEARRDWENVAIPVLLAWDNAPL